MVRVSGGRTVRPERVAREIAGILEEATTAVDHVVASAHPSPESLHRLHRQMRRLRTGLALWEALLPSAERELLHPLDVRIKRLSRLVGRIRDRDISLSLLQRFAGKTTSRRDLERLDRYRTRVQDDARTGRELLRAFLRSERQARLLDDVAERLRSLPRSGSFRDPHRAVVLAHVRTHENRGGPTGRRSAARRWNGSTGFGSASAARGSSPTSRSRSTLGTSGGSRAPWPVFKRTSGTSTTSTWSWSAWTRRSARPRGPTRSGRNDVDDGGRS